MRAAVLHEIGTIPVFGDFKEPVADDEHDVVEVLLAGLNPVDLYIASGAYGDLELPCVVGREGIARLSDGRRVYFDSPPSPFGSMAQFAPVQAQRLFDVPDGLDAGLAVALGIAGLAAWLPLTRRARLKPGQSVLVLGASGVVGQLGVQAAKLLGAGHVVAAARHRPALERLLERGADEVVELGRPGVDDAKAFADAAGSDGFDVVLDPLYGPALEAALGATSQFAHIVTVGASAGSEATIGIRHLFGRTLSGHSNTFAPLEHRREAYERMCEHALAGELTVNVEKLSLADIETAWKLQAAGPHHKITLIP
jgi:NADPH:quinone reductase-like Zn-dependent oxidoreductase